MTQGQVPEPIHYTCGKCCKPVVLTGRVRRGEYRDNITYYYTCPHPECGHSGVVPSFDAKRARGGCERCEG
jgi:hypothetical protein